MPKGERPLLKLQRAYSEAMWQWAELENAVFAIYFEAMVGFHRFPKDWEILQATYFSIMSFEIRLTMAHAAARVRWKNTRFLADWNSLRERCDKESGARGKIAHLIGTTFKPEKPHQKLIAVVTQPPFHPSRPESHGRASSEGYNVEKLKALTRRWLELTIDLMDLADLVSEEMPWIASSSLSARPSPQQSNKDGPTPKARK